MNWQARFFANERERLLNAVAEHLESATRGLAVYREHEQAQNTASGCPDEATAQAEGSRLNLSDPTFELEIEIQEAIRDWKHWTKRLAYQGKPSVQLQRKYPIAVLDEARRRVKANPKKCLTSP